MRRGFCLALASLVLAAAGWSAEPDTQVIFLRVLAPGQAVTLYERVLGIGPYTQVAVGRAEGSIVARDLPERLERFSALLGELDRSGEAGARIYARPVTYRPPSELARLARETWAGAGRGPVQMAADDRSWTLVVRARPRIYEALDKLLRRLDVRPEGGRR